MGISRYAFTGIFEGGKAKINLEILGGEGSKYRVSKSNVKYFLFFFLVLGV